jgi:uncharacterized protein DUF3421
VASLAVCATTTTSRAQQFYQFNEWQPGAPTQYEWNAIRIGTDATSGMAVTACRAYYIDGNGVLSVQFGKRTSNTVDPFSRDPHQPCQFSYGGVPVQASAAQDLVPPTLSVSGTLPAPPQAAENQIVGHDTNGSFLYPCAAPYANGIILGKYKPGAGCYIPFSKEVLITNQYSILADFDSLPFVLHAPANPGTVPDGALPMGYIVFTDNSKALLYICFATAFNAFTPGWTRQGDTNCHISYGGNEDLISAPNWQLVLLGVAH